MNKSLILYFSRADENYGVDYTDIGNTEIIANYIKEETNADMFKVERLTSYAKDYNTCTKEAKEELDNNILPELKNYLDNIDEYDVIYLGTPVYWSYMPRPLVAVLKKLNWNGKTIKPFITHEGSGSANIPKEISSICIGANVLEELTIYGSKAKSSKEIVKEWLSK